MPVAKRATIGRPVAPASDSKARRPARPCESGRARRPGPATARRGCGVRRGRGRRRGSPPAATERASSSATVGNSVRIWRSRSYPRTQPVVAEQHAADEAEHAEHHRRCHPARAAEGADHGDGCGGAEADEPPHDLLDAELLHRAVEPGAPQPPAYGRAAAEHPLDQVGGRADAGPEDPRRGRRRRGRHRTQRRGLVAQRQVAEVGQHPHAELGAPQHADPQGDEQEPGPRESSQAPPHTAVLTTGSASRRAAGRCASSRRRRSRRAPARSRGRARRPSWRSAG